MRVCEGERRTGRTSESGPVELEHDWRATCSSALPLPITRSKTATLRNVNFFSAQDAANLYTAQPSPIDVNFNVRFLEKDFQNNFAENKLPKF
jgi:hypothetical protein